MPPHISKLQIEGYKAFKDTTFDLGMLEVIAGANGSGKSSLFEFLKFIRDAADRDIPPEVIEGSQNQEIFNDVKNPLISSELTAANIGYTAPIVTSHTLKLTFSITGPRGNARITSEKITDIDSKMTIDRDESPKFQFMQIPDKRFVLANKYWASFDEFINNLRFYSAFAIDKAKISLPMYIQQEPTLFEDCGNLSSILNYLMTEYPENFEELQMHLRSVVPGFKGLTVKARGGPGQVIAYWKEDNIDSELTLADVSEGILRLICWFALCLHPKPPSLVCIDEPEMGIHPRALSVFAGLLQKLSERTQVLVATHSSYFLTQFELRDIAVMKKEDGEAKFSQPKDSEVLTGILDDFGSEEIESLHISDELEHFS